MTPKRAKVLSPEEMEAAATEMAEIAREENIPAAVIGGFAMRLYGSIRFTADVDIAALEELPDYEYEGTLSFGGNVLRAGNGARVCWVVRDDAYEELYQEAVRMAVPVEGETYNVVQPEHLAAMKLAARRHKDEEDLMFLLMHTDIDVGGTRDIVNEYLGPYAAEDFDSYVREATWRIDKENE